MPCEEAWDPARCAAALPERPLVWPARRSGWWQRTGDQVAVDACGNAGALRLRDVPPPVEGEEPTVRQLPRDRAGVGIRRRRIEAGPDDQDRSGGPAVERAGVPVTVARWPGGARLGQVCPEGSERTEAMVALPGHGWPAEGVAGVVGVGARDGDQCLVRVVVGRCLPASRDCRGGPACGRRAGLVELLQLPGERRP